MLDDGEPTFVVVAAMTKLLTRLIMHSINICGTCQLELKRHSCPHLTYYCLPSIMESGGWTAGLFLQLAGCSLHADRSNILLANC